MAAGNVNKEQESKLISFLNRKIELAKQSGETIFLGVPDKWFEQGLHCCNNGHVSGSYLKSEQYGRSVCFTCMQPSHLFPTDTTIEEFKQALNL